MTNSAPTFPDFAIRMTDQLGERVFVLHIHPDGYEFSRALPGYVKAPVFVSRFADEPLESIVDRAQEFLFREYRYAPPVPLPQTGQQALYDPALLAQTGTAVADALRPLRTALANMRAP